MYFKKNRQIYDVIGALDLPGVEFADSFYGNEPTIYLVAIQEGSQASSGLWVRDLW